MGALRFSCFCECVDPDTFVLACGFEALVVLGKDVGVPLLIVCREKSKDTASLLKESSIISEKSTLFLV